MASRKTPPSRKPTAPPEAEDPRVQALAACQEQLAQAAQKAAYVESIPTPVIAIDRDFTVTFINPAGAAVLKRTPQEVIGMKCYQLFKTAHCRTAECCCGRAMAENGIFTAETVADPAGLNIPIRYTGTPLKNASGEIIGALEYVLDITATRKAMDDANQKVDYLNKIPTPVMVIDRDFTVTFMNPAGAAALGQSPDRVLGAKCYELFNTLHCRTDECRCAQAMTKNGVFTGDTLARLPGGALPIRYTAAPLKGKDGQVIGALEYVINISEENAAVAEVKALVEAAVAGDLGRRGDPAKFEIAGFKNVIKGINEMMDAIVRPVNEALAVMERVKENDLTLQMEGEYQGDYAKMKEAVNAAVDSLRGLVGEIKANAENLAQASDQLAQAASQAGQATQQVAATSQDMAKGAGNQASTAQETARLMQELASIIEQVARRSQEQAEGVGSAASNVGEVSASAEQMAQNAAVAAENSKTAAAAAKEGADKARRTVQGMERITATVDQASEKVTGLGAQSEEIGKIVAVIDDIAAQTNLLALNAAIEAARAGEHGRGFAVVSDEVRKLAERTASATKEIADLIRNIQKGVAEAVKAMQEGATEVKTGYQLATEAGNALEGILAASEKVNEQIAQIAAGAQQVSASANDLVRIIESVGTVTEENSAAAQQMASTSEGVSRSVESIAGIAQENSAATEEVSASAEEMGAQVQEMVASAQSLKEMAEQLRAATARFTLSRDGEMEERQPALARA